MPLSAQNMERRHQIAKGYRGAIRFFSDFNRVVRQVAIHYNTQLAAFGLCGPPPLTSTRSTPPSSLALSIAGSLTGGLYLPRRRPGPADPRHSGPVLIPPLTAERLATELHWINDIATLPTKMNSYLRLYAPREDDEGDEVVFDAWTTPLEFYRTLSLRLYEPAGERMLHEVINVHMPLLGEQPSYAWVKTEGGAYWFLEVWALFTAVDTNGLQHSLVYGAWLRAEARCPSAQMIRCLFSTMMGNLCKGEGGGCFGRRRIAQPGVLFARGCMRSWAERRSPKTFCSSRASG
jgi:hypothetical protein